MSHDRGCPCGREKDEYPTCLHRSKCIKAGVVAFMNRTQMTSNVEKPAEQPLVTVPTDPRERRRWFPLMMSPIRAIRAIGPLTPRAAQRCPHCGLDLSEAGEAFCCHTAQRQGLRRGTDH